MPRPASPVVGVTMRNWFWIAITFFGFTTVGALAVAQTGAPDGQAIYNARCAGCHDHPAGRTPTRAVIGRNSAWYILNVLTNGVMAPYAEGLSVAEKTAVAGFVSLDKGGSNTAASMETPPCLATPTPTRLGGRGWNGWGRAVENTRYQPEPGLAARDIPRLKLKWAMFVHGSRSGESVIAGDKLFTNDTAGAVYALDARTGCAWWRFKADGGTRSTISLVPLSAPSSRSRLAAVFTDALGYLHAVDADTGAEIWKTLIDVQPGHQFTGSVTVFGGVIYAPVASGEEAFATNDHYACCRFRGALVAVAADTGKMLWTTYTTQTAPAPTKKNRLGVQMYGPAGGAIWSAPTIDAKRGVAYVATGNSYTDLPHEGAEAVIAIDLKTGRIAWINQLTHGDNYIIDCYGPVEKRYANCPTVEGGDFDFGASPSLTRTPAGRPVLLASQKSGQVYALDPDARGKVIWERRLSPGGPLGGSEFGHATDAANVYVGISDIYLKPDAARPQITALRLADGALSWTHPLTRRPCRWTNVYCAPGISMAVSAMPGAVFAGSLDGWLSAYSTADGKLLWTVDTALPVTTTTGVKATGGTLDEAGPVIVHGMVYIHSGYWGRTGLGSVLQAYSVDGK